MRHRTTQATQDQAIHDEWPQWAQEQLLGAVEVAHAFARCDHASTLAGELYHRWFTPPQVEIPADLLRRPLAGLYRSAHAGSSRRLAAGEVQVIDRRDVLGRDRWWRTWGEQWTPARSRTRTTRLLLAPRMEALGDFVAAATRTLLQVDEPWLLALPTLPSRLRHSGSAVIYVPDDERIQHLLVDALSGYMRADTPPLCLPLAPGAALADHPGNGMTFGEHRSHLVALALEAAPRDPLRAIAEVFGMHGVSPAEPHRTNGLG